MGWLAGLLLVAGPFIVRIFMALGITLATYTSATVVCNQLTETIVSYYGGMAGSVAQILNLGGVGTALSVITGAYIYKAAIMALNVFFMKSS